MSKYFRTLKRVEGSRVPDSHTRPESGTAEAAGDSGLASPRSLARSARPRPVAAVSNATAGAALVDGLLSVARRASGAVVVVAGTSVAEDVSRLVAATVGEAQRRNLKLLVGRLETAGRRLIVESRNPQLSRGAAQTPATGKSQTILAPPVIDVTWGSNSMELQAVLERSSVGCDLIILQAPALDASPDAALLGKCFNGVILVVRPLATTRRAIKAAVAKAELVGCPVRGFIVDGSRTWIPGWLERLLPKQSL